MRKNPKDSSSNKAYGIDRMGCTCKKSTIGEVLPLFLCYIVPGTEDRFKAKAPWHESVREAMGKRVAHIHASERIRVNVCVSGLVALDGIEVGSLQSLDRLAEYLG